MECYGRQVCSRAVLLQIPSPWLMDRWTVRALTLQETLCLFQMPLGMDPLLAGFNPGHRLPFVDQPSPDLFTSFFRQLWGDNGGGLGDIEGEEEEEEEKNEYEDNGDEGGGGAAVSTERVGWDGMVISMVHPRPRPRPRMHPRMKGRRSEQGSVSGCVSD